MPDKELKIEITAEGDAAAKIKEAADESARYQQVLEQMASKDSDAEQAKRWEEINAQAKAYTAAGRTRAEAASLAAAAEEKLSEETKLRIGQLPGLRQGEEKAAEGMRLFRGEGQEAHRIISELNRITPMLGEAFRLLRSPIGGAIAAAIGVFVELKSHIDETNKALDEMGHNNAIANFLPNIEDRIGVFAAAASAAQSYSDKLNQIATGTQSVNDKLKDQLGLDKAIEQANSNLESAKKGLAIARLQQDEAAHKIRPEQAAEKRAQIEKDFLAQQQRDREAAQDKEIATKQKQIDADMAVADELARKQRETTNAVTTDEAHRAAAKASLPDLNKQLADAQGALDKHINEYQSHVSSFIWTTPDDKLSQPQREAKRGLDSATAEDRAKITQIEAQINQFRATTTDESAKKLQAEHDAADQASADRLENTKQIRELSDSIKQLNATIAAVRPIEQQTTETQQETIDAQENARLAGQFAKDFKTLDELTRTENPSQELLQKVSETMADTIALLNDHNELLKTLPDYSAVIADLRRDAQTIKDAESNSRNTQGGQG